MAAIETLATVLRPDRTAAVPGCASAEPVSRLEWQVVQLALREAEARAPAVPPRGRIGRWFRSIHRWITGIEPAAGLADPRLEAVRRFVLAIRRGSNDVAERADALLMAGFTEGQVCAMATAGR